MITLWEKKSPFMIRSEKIDVALCNLGRGVLLNIYFLYFIFDLAAVSGFQPTQVCSLASLQNLAMDDASSSGIGEAGGWRSLDSSDNSCSGLSVSLQLFVCYVTLLCSWQQQQHKRAANNPVTRHISDTASM